MPTSSSAQVTSSDPAASTNRHQLSLVGLDSADRKVRFKDRHRGAESARREIQETLNLLRASGYLLSRVDSLEVGPDSTWASFVVGPRFSWTELDVSGVATPFLRAAGYRDHDWDGRAVSPKSISRLADQVLVYAENHGWPFAELRMDSSTLIQKDGQVGIRTSLTLNPGPLIMLDSIRVQGNVKLAKPFLERYLGLQEGKPYNEQAVLEIGQRLQELTFLRETQPARVLFYGDRAGVGLYLEKRNASRFDFLLGVLPNSDITGRLTITGEGSLELRNSFGFGEGIAVDYRALQAGTQELEARVDLPYLPYLPFGADVNFDLYIRDSSFLNREFDLALTYPLGANDYFSGFVESDGSSLLNLDTARVLNTRTLPSNQDVRATRYGLAYRLERLDYRFNPRSGFSIRVSGSAGTRRVLKNQTVTGLVDPFDPEFDFGSLYDSIDTRTGSYKIEGRITGFVPLGKRSVFHAAVTGGWLYGGELFGNDLYRLGGTRLLRGFDEESIFANGFAIGTIEYRFLLGRNSFLYLFTDGAWLKEKRSGVDRSDTPFGFGAGLNFETAAGIFGISYAIGRQQRNPIEFRAAKIHFGYVNLF